MLEAAQLRAGSRAAVLAGDDYGVNVTRAQSAPSSNPSWRQHMARIVHESKEDRMARRAIAVLSLGLLAALPATAGASSLELRIGGFIPRADSNLFRDDSDLYTVNKKGLGRRLRRGRVQLHAVGSRGVRVHLDGLRPPRRHQLP